MRQNKLDKTAKYTEIKSINTKLKQSELARALQISSSTLHKVQDINNNQLKLKVIDT